MLDRITDLIFPPKCILCEKLLEKEETDLCHHCRTNAPEVTNVKSKLSFIAGWTAIWYYKGSVRESLLRYKFRNTRSYAAAYGRILAMKLDGLYSFDVLTWVPVSKRRRWKRGFDQVKLLACSVGKELGIKPVRSLRKIRHTPPQSSISGQDKRRANILGAYRVVNPTALLGKRVLLLDDIITTGATASECARTLLTAGAKEVYFAAVAASYYKNDM